MEINIPQSVTSIESYAFDSCTSLISINLAESITNLSCYAFSNCTSLTNINISEKITNIGNRAFNGCTSLKEIIVAEDNNVYTSIDGVVYNMDKTLLICYPAGKVGEYTVLSSVKNILNETFENCTNLTKINLPEGITNIGESAFKSCTSLKSISIPDAVTYIAWGSFIGCTNLTTIYANSDSYASKYEWPYGTVYTKTGYTAGSLIIKTKNDSDAKIAEASKALLSYTTAGGLETDVAYQDVQTTLSQYLTSELIEAETDMAKLTSWITELDGKITTLNNTEIKPLELTINSFESNIASPQNVGTLITLSSTSSGGTGILQSKFVAFDGTTYTTIKNYSTQATATWKPTKPGTYTIFACVMDTTGKIERKSINYVIK